MAGLEKAMLIALVTRRTGTGEWLVAQKVEEILVTGGTRHMSVPRTTCEL
jgi:hypothetical protein